MGKITCFEAQNKRQIVEYFYEREDESLWHRMVHKNGGSAVENINSTLDSISEESVMYEVDVEGELAAFFVKYEDKYGALALEGFHVGKEFRTQEFLGSFWKIIREKMISAFWVGICDKNRAAIDHLLKQGFKIYSNKKHDGNIFFILKSE